MATGISRRPFNMQARPTNEKEWAEWMLNLNLMLDDLTRSANLGAAGSLPIPGSLIHDSGLRGAAADNYDVAGLDALSHGGYVIEGDWQCPAGAYTVPSIIIDNGAGGWYSTVGDYSTSITYNQAAVGGGNWLSPMLAVPMSGSVYATYFHVRIELVFNASGETNWSMIYDTFSWGGATRTAPSVFYNSRGVLWMPARKVSNIVGLRFQALYNAATPVTVLTNGIGVNSRFRVWRKK